ncbi:MAG: 16S rRNA pseudouridine(516) synthase [Clostridia bacterium]|nr:16S rRNA pseudouridine(516) synthase [Clostridia bacterium]
MGLKRLDKLIALHCNVSRKEARQLIKDAAVTVNGQRAMRAEELIDTEADDVAVKGFNFTMREHLYLMLNKPQGVISATTDPTKATVLDILPESLRRRSLFPAGRLDRDSTGLLIITDDGAFAHRIMSPAHHVYKTYEVTLSAPLDDAAVAALEAGIRLADGTDCLPAKVRVFSREGTPCAEIRIREGKYHQVKRMVAAVGSHVEHLHRTQIGRLQLDPALAPGDCRPMTDAEVSAVLEDMEQ